MPRFVIIEVLVLACGGVYAQENAPPIDFEAVSIKPFPEGANIMMSGCMGGPGSEDPGSIVCEYTTLKMLLMKAYNVKAEEIFGPNWLDSAHFNISAKLPRGSTKQQVSVMFRNLLANRFKVSLHHEDRSLPAYELTVGKSGLKIKQSAQRPPLGGTVDAPPASGPPIGEDGFPILRAAVIAGGPIVLYRNGRARLQASNATLGALADAISRQLDRVVVDDTGLAGNYDITLNWTPEATEPGGLPRQTRAGPGSGGAQEAGAFEVDLFGALERQAGLKLAPKKIQRDTLVIDRAEKVPTEN